MDPPAMEIISQQQIQAAATVVLAIVTRRQQMLTRTAFQNAANIFNCRCQTKTCEIGVHSTCAVYYSFVDLVIKFIFYETVSVKDSLKMFTLQMARRSITQPRG